MRKPATLDHGVELSPSGTEERRSVTAATCPACNVCGRRKRGAEGVVSAVWLCPSAAVDHLGLASSQVLFVVGARRAAVGLRSRGPNDAIVRGGPVSALDDRDLLMR